jgi:tetratricopeptide (TPR) repeat protein
MPSIADIYSLARQQQLTGGLAQAEHLYRQILETDPSQADVWCSLGEVCESQGKLGEAEICCRRAVQLRPGLGKAHNWLGIVLAQQRRMGEAVTSFREAVRFEPNDAEYQHNLGVALDRQGQTEAAISSYRQAIRLNPQFAQAHYNLGLALNSQNKRDEAIEAYRKALQFRPNYPQALNDLGNALAAQEKLDEAVVNYQKAMRLQPQFADAYYNLGIALGKQQKHDEAMVQFRQAIRIKPDFAEAHVHMGDVYRLKGETDEALVCFKHALRYKPSLPGAHWNRALLLLLCGEFEQGWAEYEWRWAQYDFAKRQFAQPQWEGSLLNGRILLLHTEQGLGDTLHVIRYLSLVNGLRHNTASRVVVECQPALVPLLSGMPGIDLLLPYGAKLPSFDVHAPLLSLPGIFHTTLDTIPRAVPYLHAKPELVDHWKRRAEFGVRSAELNNCLSTPRSALRTDPHFLIGISWQGSIANPADRSRSIPLSAFAPLARVDGVGLVSLQKGPGTDQLQELKGQFDVLELKDLDDESGAFMDTAAIMRRLDLVVSTDTALGHLAGALGVPVWLALTMAPDWRWLLKREDSPWYPTMRLFRQTKHGRWEDVIKRMAEELKQAMNGKRAEPRKRPG